MQVFSDALYREYKPDALERYDQALNKGREAGETPKIDSALFSDVLQMIDENRRDFRKSDEKDYQKLDDGLPYQKESREYTEQEKYNYKYEVKPQGVQQEIHQATLETSDFSPSVLSGNNQASGIQQGDSSVVVEDSPTAPGDGFEFGEVEQSIVAERAQSPADKLLSEISTSEQTLVTGNAATDPTIPDPSVNKV